MQQQAVGGVQAELDHPVVIFDGECGLCQAGVQFMLRNDPPGKLRFAPRQSAPGQALLVQHGFVDAAPNSVVLIEKGKALTGSTAALRIARYLRFPWPLGAAALLIPRPLRDIAYDWVARNRYRWSRKPAACRIPTADERRRFLDLS
ncbi:MAG: putative thiol-disulfide oxidoreductase [Armatimonadetes bacterium]|jgi:predicted DCC family thiol-disulfide oxidoreductase YuxK|nr:putative thiol-disulfide oxidoreductase [Armatimonadota bacterium]